MKLECPHCHTTVQTRRDRPDFMTLWVSEFGRRRGMPNRVGVVVTRDERGFADQIDWHKPDDLVLAWDA